MATVSVSLRRPAMLYAHLVRRDRDEHRRGARRDEGHDGSLREVHSRMKHAGGVDDACKDLWRIVLADGARRDGSPVVQIGGGPFVIEAGWQHVEMPPNHSTVHGTEWTRPV